MKLAKNVETKFLKEIFIWNYFKKYLFLNKNFEFSIKNLILNSFDQLPNN